MLGRGAPTLNGGARSPSGAWRAHEADGGGMAASRGGSWKLLGWAGCVTFQSRKHFWAFGGCVEGGQGEPTRVFRR